MSIFGLDVADVPVLSLVVSTLAVTASLTGLIVSYGVARMQTVSPIRQRWIDELRSLLSEYISECEGLVFLEKDGLLNALSLDEAIIKRLLYLGAKIELMLNPTETVHSELIDIIRAISNDMHHGVADLLDFGGRIKGVTEVSQKIFREEWKKIKFG